MGIVAVALVLFISLIIWLLVSNLMGEKDKIITDNLLMIAKLSNEIAKIKKDDHEHKMWLVDIAHLTKLSEIKNRLINYAQPKQPNKNVDPKAKTKHTYVKSRT